MDELDLQLELLYKRRVELQSEIDKPFEYGRSLSDEEYLALAAPVEQLIKLTYAVDQLLEVQGSISSNHTNSLENKNV